MDGVRRIEIGDGERRNALTLADRRRLAAALRGADRDPEVRVIVLRGAGGHFCSGGDVREFERERDWVEAQRYAVQVAQESFAALRLSKTASIACVEGVAAGAGMYLALACDVVVAADSARFHPSHLDLGVVPDWGALWLLPRLVGLARAKALVIGGGSIEAAAAERIGLIAECVPAARLEAVVDGYCERLTGLPAEAVALALHGLEESGQLSAPDFLEWEAAAIAATASSPEHRQRVREFLGHDRPGSA